MKNVTRKSVELGTSMFPKRTFIHKQFTVGNTTRQTLDTSVKHRLASGAARPPRGGRAAALGGTPGSSATWLP